MNSRRVCRARPAGQHDAGGEGVGTHCPESIAPLCAQGPQAGQLKACTRQPFQHGLPAGAGDFAFHPHSQETGILLLEGIIDGERIISPDKAAKICEGFSHAQLKKFFCFIFAPMAIT